MMDLFLSASLGRPPATSDYDHDIRDDLFGAGKQQRNLTPEQQLSVAVTSLCRILERILTDVYMKQVISIHVAESISNQHRAWVRTLPTFLRLQPENTNNKNMKDGLAAAHVFGSYYWSIILLTRPFLIYRVAQYVKSHEADFSANAWNGNACIALFADACVYSALRALDMVQELGRHETLPRRLPFLINSAFNSAVVLGAAFFADYDNLLPIDQGMDKAERFLELFIPHDPHACRFFQIIKYLRGAVVEYVKRRNSRWMERRSKQVDQLFGQVGGSSDPASSAVGSSHDILGRWQSYAEQPPTVPSPNKRAQHPNTSFLAAQPQVSAGPQPPGSDVWDVLCGEASQATTLSYEAAISALTTSGVPIGCSSGGTVSSGHPQILDNPSPLSDMLFPENDLLYMAEDLPMFGSWDDI